MAAQELGYALPPRTSEATYMDRRGGFQQDRASLPGPAEERQFIANKFNLLRTDPMLHPADRARSAEIFSSNTAYTFDVLSTPPVPGGVGYGFFYNNAFKANFATGTSISWEIICPTIPGGSVSDFLYITATNRSAKGVEAFAAYHGQEQFSFDVFDWAQPENQHWQVKKPFQEMNEYIGGESLHGLQLQVVAVMNSTYQDSPGTWVNEVWLFNVAKNRWDLVYRFGYPATLADQTSGWVGSWGPIVETFENAYANTDVFGALKTQVLTRDSVGKWGQWEPLGPTQSDLRVDNKGFVQVFVDSNYSWAVRS